MKFRSLFLFPIVLFFFQSVFAQSDKGVGNITTDRKVALVIGNTNYGASIGRLQNPVNDATDVGKALQRLGFSLLGGKPQMDLGKREMLELIREFGRQIRQGGVGVFYFSGHGVQVEKKNYIIPITDLLVYEDDAETEAIDVDTVAKEMEFAGNRLNILILDACRNNALRKRSKDTINGLTEPKRKPKGTLIAFAADDGQTASDNTQGRNGLFTQELLKNLETPNTRLDDIFRSTRNQVESLSNGRQSPMIIDKTNEAVILKPAGASGAVPGSEASSNTISRGPKLSEWPSYTHTSSQVNYRLFAEVLEYNSKEYIDREIDRLVRQEKTHLWDDKWYYQALPKSTQSLLLGWKNLDNNELGWILLQRNTTDDWFYRTNARGYEPMIVGKEDFVLWTNTPVKIYFKAPKLTDTWNREDIQYRFGW